MGRVPAPVRAVRSVLGAAGVGLAAPPTQADALHGQTDTMCRHTPRTAGLGHTRGVRAACGCVGLRSSEGCMAGVPILWVPILWVPILWDPVPSPPGDGCAVAALLDGRGNLPVCIISPTPPTSLQRRRDTGTEHGQENLLAAPRCCLSIQQSAPTVQQRRCHGAQPGSAQTCLLSEPKLWLICVTASRSHVFWGGSGQIWVTERDPGGPTLL